MVEKTLHRSAIVYGNTALIISCGYLFGTLINRFLIKKITICNLVNLGFILLFIALLLQFVYAIFWNLNILTLVILITLINFSSGFIYINIFSSCLRLTHTTAGIATALFSSINVVIGAFGSYIVNDMHITYLGHLSIIYTSTSLMQLIIFYLFFKNIFKQVH